LYTFFRFSAAWYLLALRLCSESVLAKL
jgi:hypothetical protein